MASDDPVTGRCGQAAATGRYGQGELRGGEELSHRSHQTVAELGKRQEKCYRSRRSNNNTASPHLNTPLHPLVPVGPVGILLGAAYPQIAKPH